MLNVIGIKDLYESWENNYHNILEDYKGQDGENRNAVKVDWVSKLPKIFSMQMNRIRFIDGNA